MHRGYLDMTFLEKREETIVVPKYSETKIGGSTLRGLNLLQYSRLYDRHMTFLYFF